VYLLQKLSEGEVHVLHEKLISRLEQAIEDQKADEFEWYGLEFLTQHNAVNAMLNGDGSKLLDLAYNQKHWQRQQKISKGYIWTKAGLHSVMNWASKYNDDQVIECGLQLVDLHHQEQNAATQIVALVADGDFDSALKRIEQFKENDKEGFQRKFVLYMLCLMELTLLNSKDKPFQKGGIDKILKHLDEQIPVDHSVLNWGEYFSSYLVFQISSVIAELELDFMIIYQRTNDWEIEWIKSKGPYSKIESQVLLTSIRCFNDSQLMSNALFDIAIDLAVNSNTQDSAIFLEESIITNEDKSDLFLRFTALKEIARRWNVNGQDNELEELISLSVSIIGLINDFEEKTTALFELAKFYRSCGQSEKAIVILNNNLDYIQNSEGGYTKDYALSNIALELCNLGLFNEAISVFQQINEESIKTDAFLSIISEKLKLDNSTASRNLINELIENDTVLNNVFVKIDVLLVIFEQKIRQGLYDEASLLLNEVMTLKNLIESNYKQDKVLEQIVYKMSSLEMFNEALFHAESIKLEDKKDNVLYHVSVQLSMSDHFSKAYECALKITSKKWMRWALYDISIESLKRGFIKEALSIVELLTDQKEKEKLLLKIAIELIQQDNLNDSVHIFFESLKSPKYIENETERYNSTCEISNSLIRKGQHEASIFFVQSIENNTLKNMILSILSAELVKEDKNKVFKSCIQHIDNSNWKCHALNASAHEMIKIGKFSKAKILLENAVEIALTIDDFFWKENILSDVANEYAHIGLVDQAMILIQEMSNEDTRISSMFGVSKELTKQGRITESSLVIRELLHISRSSKDEDVINWILEESSIEICRHGNISESLRLVRTISDKYMMITAFIAVLSEAYKILSEEEIKSLIKEILDLIYNLNLDLKKTRLMIKLCSQMFDLGNEKVCKQLIVESCEYAQNISNIDEMNSAHKDIAIELAKQAQYDHSLAMVNEISSEEERKTALNCIAIEMIKNAQWKLAEGLIREIPQNGSMADSTKKIASEIIKHFGWENALHLCNQFSSVEIRLNFLSEWTSQAKIINCDKFRIINSCHYYKEDIENLEKLFYKLALNELFMNDYQTDKIDRMRRSLNIQWAIDIKNQLPN
jgi:tetratricopeptide (TPR) repeat protein